MQHSNGLPLQVPSGLLSFVHLEATLQFQLVKAFSHAKLLTTCRKKCSESFVFRVFKLYQIQIKERESEPRQEMPQNTKCSKC